MTAPSLKFPARVYAERLASLEEPGYINPWGGDEDEAHWRVASLREHLWRRQPEILLVSSTATPLDCLATGIPLVSRAAWFSNLVPFLPPTDASAERVRADFSCSIWRALNLHGMGRFALTFPLLPLIPEHGVQPTPALISKYAVWAETLIRFYPGLRLIALGSTASRTLFMMGMQHATLEPPNRCGTSLFDQLGRMRRDGIDAWDLIPEVSGVESY